MEEKKVYPVYRVDVSVIRRRKVKDSRQVLRVRMSLIDEDGFFTRFPDKIGLVNEVPSIILSHLTKRGHRCLGKIPFSPDQPWVLHAQTLYIVAELITPAVEPEVH
jgi:hypothetical protein